jgi:tRNA(fMet)-specific endonuclease VapC
MSLLPCEVRDDRNHRFPFGQQPGRAPAQRVPFRLDDWAIPIVWRGELEFGLLRRPVRRDIAERMRGLLQQIPTLTLPPGTADHCAAARHERERSGQPIGANDLWIATHDLTVVTGNTREFTRVPGLRVENWLR